MEQKCDQVTTKKKRILFVSQSVSIVFEGVMEEEKVRGVGGVEGWGSGEGAGGVFFLEG